MQLLLSRRRSLKTVFVALLLFVMSWFLVLPIHADNHDVKDDAGVLNRQTQQYIYDVNENQMAKIKGHPQIAVITKKSVDGDIEDEAQDLFNQYQFGNKGYDNGVLLLIDVDGHHVRMQTGYGIESAVPDDFVNDLMNDNVKSDFRSGDYSAGTQDMVKRLAQRITDHQDELRSKSEVNNHQAAIEAQEQKQRQEMQYMMGFVKTVFVIVLILVLGLGVFRWFYALIKHYRQDKLIEAEFNDLVSQAKDLSLDINWDEIKLSPIDEAEIRQKLDDGKAVDNGRQDLRVLINLLIINQLVYQENHDWGLLADDGSVKNSQLAQTIIKHVDLNRSKMNYQVFVDRIASYLQFVHSFGDYLKAHDVKSDQDNLTDWLKQTAAYQRSGWPDVHETTINKQIKSQVADFKNNGQNTLVAMSTNFDVLQDLLVSALNGRMLSQSGLYSQLFEQYKQDQAHDLISALDNKQQVEHAQVVNQEFDKMMNKSDVANLIDDDELAYRDRLTLAEKEEALRHQDDDAAFRAAVVGYLAGYLASHHSYSSSSWDDDDDDDDWFGGSGSGFGGGGFSDFGGGGGFSGGGGGTAGW